VSRTIRDGGIRGKQTHEDSVHSRPAAGAGEGVPVQPLHLEAAPRGAGADPGPHRAPHQDLVPEPAHEVEEGGRPKEGEGVRTGPGLIYHLWRPGGGRGRGHLNERTSHHFTPRFPAALPLRACDRGARIDPQQVQTLGDLFLEKQRERDVTSTFKETLFEWNHIRIIIGQERRN